MRDWKYGDEWIVGNTSLGDREYKEEITLQMREVRVRGEERDDGTEGGG